MTIRAISFTGAEKVGSEQYEFIGFKAQKKISEKELFLKQLYGNKKDLAVFTETIKPEGKEKMVTVNYIVAYDEDGAVINLLKKAQNKLVTPKRKRLMIDSTNVNQTYKAIEKALDAAKFQIINNLKKLK